MDSAALETVQAWLREAPQIAVLTGAGVSAESGVPTFRDAQTGYWAQFRPEDMATEEGFRAQPALVWRWYQHRRQLLQGVQPNAAHRALAAFAQQHPGRLTLITQNVDGLHQRAGSKGVIEYHGNILRDRCSAEGTIARRSSLSITGLPECARCGELLRPDVVWFGESIPRLAALESGAAAADCDVFLSIGTASVVYPAAGLAESAQRSGATIIEVNTESTSLTPLADFSLRGPSGQVLPQLLQVLRG